MSSVATKCVLVVDDDYTIRELISDVLQRKGYYVEMADNGQQALAQVRLTQPDAIVLDLMMPVMDGWAFLEQYRTEPAVGPPTSRADVRVYEVATDRHCTRRTGHSCQAV
jgi:CheY-like chemotaxis protein